MQVWFKIMLHTLTHDSCERSGSFSIQYSNHNSQLSEKSLSSKLITNRFI